MFYKCRLVLHRIAHLAKYGLSYVLAEHSFIHDSAFCIEQINRTMFLRMKITVSLVILSVLIHGYECRGFPWSQTCSGVMKYYDEISKCMDTINEMKTQESLDSLERLQGEFPRHYTEHWEDLENEKEAFVDVDEKIKRTQQNDKVEQFGANVEKWLNEINRRVQDLQERTVPYTDMSQIIESIVDNTQRNVRNLENTVMKMLDEMASKLKEDIATVGAKVEQVNEINARKILELENKLSDMLARGNLALGKPATQSSTYGGNDLWNANVATDGMQIGDGGNKSCTHTDTEVKPWWEVDLGGRHRIHRVDIQNRFDCCESRLHDLIVTVSETENGDKVLCGRFEGPSTIGALETINCESGAVTGRFVRIQIDGSRNDEYLSMVEVYVY